METLVFAVVPAVAAVLAAVLAFWDCLLGSWRWRAVGIFGFGFLFAYLLDGDANNLAMLFSFSLPIGAMALLGGLTGWSFGNAEATRRASGTAVSRSGRTK